MFGSLKKRLQQAVEKVSNIVSKNEAPPKPVHDDDSIRKEIHKEAELIAKSDTFEEITREAAKEEEAEKFERVIEKVLTEEGKTALEAREEAHLLAETRPFSEVISEEVSKEDIQEAEEKLGEIIERTEEAQVKEERVIEQVEQKVDEIKEKIELDVAAERIEEAQRETQRQVEKIEGPPVYEEVKVLKQKTDLEKLVEETAPEYIPEPRVPEIPKQEERKGLLRKITEKTLTPEDIEVILKELEMALLENDVSVEVAERIGSDIKKQLAGVSVRRGTVEDVIKDALRNAVVDVLSQETIDLDALIEKKEGPFTIMMVGFNGVGKTTTLAKLANKLRKYQPVLAAADTFRAASIEQLEEHGKKLSMRVIKHTYGSDPAAVIFDARKHAAANGNKLVLADTAGRSHSNANLMDELKKITRVNSPDLKILVLDSITGNDIYEQCRLFNDAVGVDAIILTKADVYERGGAALSAAYTLKKPILFLGVGQEYKDLIEFSPEMIAKNLLG